MQKTYFLAALLLSAAISKAQAPCDTANMPIPSNWISQSYVSAGFFGMLGYISGINSDNFTIQANYFDLSSTSYAYLLGVMVKFTKANTNQDTNLNKPVYFRLYADNNGVPGSEITNDQTKGQATLSSIKNDVANGNLTGINFASPIALPSNKKFYVAVDMSNFEWYSPEDHYDSICIATTGDNETTNTAWNFDADPMKWKSYPKVWDAPPNDDQPLDVTLYIFPYVSTSQAGCALLPVTLISFNAQRNSGDALIKWQVANEMNMKGYEVEKSDNNNIFLPVISVAAHNDMKSENYTITDRNAFVNSNIVQYRLKQIDGDGSVSYSNIVKLSYDKVGITFANPFKGALNVELNVSSAQKIALNLYDLQGKLVFEQKPAIYNSSTSIRLNGTADLAPGTYILKMNTDTEQHTYKLIKQ
jgi:hypothetical protein